MSESTPESPHTFTLNAAGLAALSEIARRRNCSLDSALSFAILSQLPDHPLHWRMQKQGRAHQAVNNAVRRGKIPPAHALPCVDCGHEWREGQPNRHEYDHYLGYAPEHRLSVQAVCKSCHSKRTSAAYAKYKLPSPNRGPWR